MEDHTEAVNNEGKNEKKKKKNLKGKDKNEVR